MAETNFKTRGDLLDDLGVRCAAGVSLAKRTWYKTGGPAALMAHPASHDELAAVLARCRAEGVAVYVLGAGANLLVRDSGVDGVVIRLDDEAFRKIDINKNIVTAGAGVELFTLVTATAKAGLDGLAQVAGIPASIGGAIRMNAGGAFGDIGEAVRRVTVMSTEGEVYERNQDDLEFGYRHTNISAPFILEAEFDLDEDDPLKLMKRVKEIFIHKKNSQPMGDKSAGCCFKNPPAESGATAGQLIDRAGLKGYAQGGASVSKLHANFVVAEPGTPAIDIEKVIDHMRAQVADQFGVELQREIVIWP